MNTCVNINDIQYQKLAKCVNNENLLQLWVSTFLDAHNRFPKIDEIPFANSSKLLDENIKVSTSKQNTKYANIQSILDYTGEDNLKQAQIVLNTKSHPDLEINLLPIGQTVIVQYKRRPLTRKSQEINEIDTNISLEAQKTIFSDMLYDLQERLGVQFKTITNDELNSDQWKGLIGDARCVNAFVYNGDIYINLDNATFDSPLHELAHILIGNIRFINPTLYSNLLQLVQNIPGINLKMGQYLNRTQNDIVEELFVTEYSKFLIGQQSIFDKVPIDSLQEINYNMQRCLDTMLQGEYSVKSISNLGGETINTLSKKLESNRFNNSKTSSVDISYVHRLVNNEKSALLKEGMLKEECS